MSSPFEARCVVPEEKPDKVGIDVRRVMESWTLRRLGRKDKLAFLAFLCGTHARMGSVSPVRSLQDSAIMRMILAFSGKEIAVKCFSEVPEGVAITSVSMTQYGNIVGRQVVIFPTPQRNQDIPTAYGQKTVATFGKSFVVRYRDVLSIGYADAESEDCDLVTVNGTNIVTNGKYCGFFGCIENHMPNRIYFRVVDGDTHRMENMDIGITNDEAFRAEKIGNAGFSVETTKCSTGERRRIFVLVDPLRIYDPGTPTRPWYSLGSMRTVPTGDGDECVTTVSYGTETEIDAVIVWSASGAFVTMMARCPWVGRRSSALFEEYLSPSAGLVYRVVLSPADSITVFFCSLPFPRRLRGAPVTVDMKSATLAVRRGGTVTMVSGGDESEDDEMWGSSPGDRDDRCKALDEQNSRVWFRANSDRMWRCDLHGRIPGYVSISWVPTGDGFTLECRNESMCMIYAWRDEYGIPHIGKPITVHGDTQTPNFEVSWYCASARLVAFRVRFSDEFDRHDEEDNVVGAGVPYIIPMGENFDVHAMATYVGGFPPCYPMCDSARHTTEMRCVVFDMTTGMSLFDLEDLTKRCLSPKIPTFVRLESPVSEENDE